ncbi:hypothetical protein [Muricoccus radiodurans]|uniref:hypothetical protein n=1 Tax=Muricoccus radiodurans TaxID=2231721 RepID=UPI003CFB3FE6
MRKRLGGLAILAFMVLSTAAGAQIPLASYMGAWTTSPTGDCSRDTYVWSLDGDLITFRGPRGSVDVERVTALRADGFTTSTVASASNRPGTRWDYQIQGPDFMQIRNLATGRLFPATRCR